MDSFVYLASLFLSMIVQVVVPPLPAELIVIVAAKSFGIWTTTLVAGSGLFVGGVLVYYFASWIEKRFKNFFERGKVAKVILRLKEVETFILLIRVLPYNPSDIISYAAGLIRVSPKKFITITFFVSYIRCFLLSYFGSSIESMGSLFVVFGLLLLSAAIGWVFVFGQKRLSSSKS
ncbi:MAG: TVP38/TMEM64 family protein [Campylobacterales bacterium]